MSPFAQATGQYPRNRLNQTLDCSPPCWQSEKATGKKKHLHELTSKDITCGYHHTLFSSDQPINEASFDFSACPSPYILISWQLKLYELPGGKCKEQPRAGWIHQNSNIWSLCFLLQTNNTCSGTTKQNEHNVIFFEKYEHNVILQS